MSNNSKPEAFKNDFPNALRRNLHNWAQWRVDVNDQLVTSLMTGHRRNVDVEPLGKYLHNNKHPTENPSTLLAYSASSDNISSLGMRRFLHYGIPRAKVNQSKRQSELSSVSRAPSTYTIPEYDENAPYLDMHDPTVRQHEEFYEPPYHPPEPEPDYEERNKNKHNNIDLDQDEVETLGLSSSSTDSSDAEPLYVESPLPEISSKGGFKLGSKKSSRRPISRTYSTLNALDPIYMTQKSKKTTLGKTAKKKENSSRLESQINPPTPQPPAIPTSEETPPPSPKAEPTSRDKNERSAPVNTQHSSHQPPVFKMTHTASHYAALPMDPNVNLASSYPPQFSPPKPPPLRNTDYFFQRHSSYIPHHREVIYDYPRNFVPNRHSMDYRKLYY